MLAQLTTLLCLVLGKGFLHLSHRVPKGKTTTIIEELLVYVSFFPVSIM